MKLHEALLLAGLVVACGNGSGPAAGGEGGEAGAAGAPTAGGGSDALGGGGAAGQGGSALGPDPLGERVLAVGTEFGCALNQEKAIECWGTPSDDLGQTAAPSGNFVRIRASNSTACAIRADGRFECWGEVVAVGSGTAARDVATGLTHACVLKDAGSIVCYGPMENLAVGDWPGPFSEVGASDANSCGLHEDGNVECWGEDHHGLVSGTPQDALSGLVLGASHACGIRKGDSSVVCWGAGDESAPNGTDPDSLAYGQAIAPAGAFIELTAGLAHTCGVLEDGTVKCWGAGTTDGDCTLEALECGQAMPPDGAFVQLAAGASHTCGVRDDGSVACWGSNSAERSTPPADLRVF